jgi:hypothetical protein
MDKQLLRSVSAIIHRARPSHIFTYQGVSAKTSLREVHGQAAGAPA